MGGRSLLAMADLQAALHMPVSPVAREKTLGVGTARNWNTVTRVRAMLEA